MGHIHIDRSRERRVNSGKSDDSYPKIKTPSRDDTIWTEETKEKDWKVLHDSDLEVKLSSEEGDEIEALKGIQKDLKIIKHVSRKSKHHQSSDELNKTEHLFSQSTQSSSDARFSSHSRSHNRTKHRSQKDKTIQERSFGPSVGSVTDITDNSLPSIKRSISITLPNQLNHKLRKRIHTTNYIGSEHSRAEPEFRIRSSKASRDRQDEDYYYKLKERHLKQNDQDQSKYSQSRESSRREISDRKKHHSSFHPQLSEISNSDSRPDLQSLASHYHEVQRKNRVRREKHKSHSHLELPGLSDLARRHQDLHANRLLRINRDSESPESLRNTERRKKRGVVTGVKTGSVSDIPTVRTRDRRNKKSATIEDLEDSLASMKIESVHNSGHPENYCVSSQSLISSKTESNLKINLSQSESESEDERIESIRITKKASERSKPLKQLSQSRPSGTGAHPHQQEAQRRTKSSSQQSATRSHVIECRNVDGREDPRNERGSVQKIEIIPRKYSGKSTNTTQRAKPRKRYHTTENNSVRVSNYEQPVSALKNASSSSVSRTSKQNAAIRMRQSSRHQVELKSSRVNGFEVADTDGDAIPSYSKLDRHSEKKERNKTYGYENYSGSKVETRKDTETEAEEKTTTRVTIIEDLAHEVADTQNDKLVRMLKKIDTQTLKRRLSLDKLDDLDTDDESSLDRMLNQITAFVESKILRKRAKTNEGRSIIRFGSSTVHHYDPTDTLKPLTGLKRSALKPPSILKKKAKTGSA